eukprot:m51a1_g12999 putative 5 -nucleotidase (279) ;mRNA; f:1913-2963
MSDTTGFALSSAVHKLPDTEEPSAPITGQPSPRSPAVQLPVCSYLDEPEPVLVVAISTRALFKLEDSNAVFVERGAAAFNAHQREHEDDVLEPGVAFGLVRKLLALGGLVEVVVLSSNSPDAGVRVMRSIEAHGLRIRKAAFTGGDTKFKYMRAFNADILLSANKDVPTDPEDQIRIAFDFDRVLVDGQSDVVWQSKGPDEYFAHEFGMAKVPLNPGPFKEVMEKLHKLRKQFPNKIRLGVFTARTAPANLRVMYTLRHWNIEVDEAFFLGPLEKKEH